MKRYGGGPEIKRKVIESGTKKKLEVEIYLREIKVEKIGSDQNYNKTATFQISKTDKLEKIRKKSLNYFWLAKHKTKFYLEISWNQQIELKEANFHLSIEENKIERNQKILVTQERVNGEHFNFKQLKNRKNELLKNEKENQKKYQMSISDFLHGRSNYLSSSFIEKESSEKAIEKGVVGLVNIGNSCFLNSIVQCLSNLLPLASYFLDHHSFFLSEINKNNPLGLHGDLALEFYNLLFKIWSGHTSYFPPTVCYFLSFFFPFFLSFFLSSLLLSFLLSLSLFLPSFIFVFLLFISVVFPLLFPFLRFPYPSHLTLLPFYKSE